MSAVLYTRSARFAALRCDTEHGHQTQAPDSDTNTDTDTNTRLRH